MLIRRWCKKFGQGFANRLRRRRPRPGDKWYLDEVFIRIQGVQHYLWRAVDLSFSKVDCSGLPKSSSAARRSRDQAGGRARTSDGRSFLFEGPVATEAKVRFRACRQLSQITLAARWTAARKLRAVLS